MKSLLQLIFFDYFDQGITLAGNSLFCFLILIFIFSSHIPKADTAFAQSETDWDEITSGLWQKQVTVHEPSFNLPGAVLLIKFDPQFIEAQATSSLSFGSPSSTAEEIVKSTNSFLAINANFFDKNGKALGLIIHGGKILQKIHSGGSVLSGIFFTKTNGIFINHYADFSPNKVIEAIQAGPRLITNGRPLKLAAPLSLNRRSGIAITTEGNGLIFITLARFPGVSLHGLQRLLLSKELHVTEALNLDGGSSSQIFIRKTGDMASDISTSGGDRVPVFLTLGPRQK